MGPKPNTETRGGDRIDWVHARAGEPLPDLPPDAYPEDSEPLEVIYDEGESG